MIIGIDVRALQTGHKYRGIGEVAKQTTNRILELAARDNHDVIFYEYTDTEENPKELLEIPKELRHDTVQLGVMPEKDTTASKRQKAQRNLQALFGSSINDSGKCDVFLQFDYAFGVPKNTRTVLVKHDLIPLVFWDKFFESALVPLKNKAARTTLRTLFANYKYRRILRRGVKDAHVIISVSDSTKRDLQKFLNVRESKVRTAHLGVDMQPAKTVGAVSDVALPTKPYLLFVGAGDVRRRVDDLVAAYNNLKAAGQDIQLVLVGENFASPENIPMKQVRDAVLGSSYADDILTLGYVDDVTKQRLFSDAIAFVYPTKYEGFGIPVIEAMLMNCSIVTYKNSSIPEVAGEHALFAKSWQDIVEQTRWLLNEPPASKQKRLKAAKKHAEQFTWDKTAEVLYDELTQNN